MCRKVQNRHKSRFQASAFEAPKWSDGILVRCVRERDRGHNSVRAVHAVLRVPVPRNSPGGPMLVPGVHCIITKQKLLLLLLEREREKAREREREREGERERGRETEDTPVSGPSMRHSVSQSPGTVLGAPC